MYHAWYVVMKIKNKTKKNITKKLNEDLTISILNGIYDEYNSKAPFLPKKTFAFTSQSTLNVLQE